MKKIVLLGFILLLVPTQASAQSSLRISPAKAILNTQPGSTVRTTVTLENTTNKASTVSVKLRDFKSSDELNGEPFLLESNVSAYSLTNWFTDSNLSKQLTIPANQRIEYEAVFRVPYSAVPKTYYGALTFTTEAGTQAASSVGSLVFISIGSPPTKLGIESLEFGESDDATKPYGIFTSILNNSSDGLSTPQFNLKITDGQGNTVMEIAQNSEGSVLPSSRRRYTFTPSSELPNEQLTATLTATDQTGTTAGTTLQLDRRIDKVQQSQAEEIDPNKYSTLFAYGSAALILVLFIGLILKTKKHQK